MPDLQIEYVYFAIAIAMAASTVLAFFYRRGKKEGIDETCAKRIEKMLTDLDSKLDGEIRNTDESHRQMHEKINALRAEIAYVKGQVDLHMKNRSD